MRPRKSISGSIRIQSYSRSGPAMYPSRLMAPPNRTSRMRVPLGAWRQRGERLVKHLVGHEFRRQQTLKDEPFGERVDDADQMLRRHRQLALVDRAAQPRRAESV